jgi:hypothetical protein
MATNLLTKADPEFATLRQQDEEDREEEVRLRLQMRDLRAQGQSEDEQRQVADKLQAVQDRRQSRYGPLTVAKRRAQQVASQQIKESANYRKQALAVATTWAPFLAAVATLTAMTEGARREGVPLLPIPPTLAAMPAWVKRQIAAGVLDADSLPAAVKALVEG